MFKPDPNYFKKIAVVSKNRSDSAYKHWRDIVKAKGGHRCFICATDKNVEAHHIESFTNNEKLRLDISNGVALCKKHHKEYHRKYKEATKENWEAYLKDKKND